MRECAPEQAVSHSRYGTPLNAVFLCLNLERKMEAKKELSFEVDREYLHRQLVRLGDMIGDGLHLEPDGKWITREYRKVSRSLGYLKPKPRKNRSQEINDAMALRVAEVNCQKCGGQLKQTRSGSMKAACACGAKYTLLKRSNK